MPENPVTPALPADLPENWQSNQIISPGGTEVGLTEQHGYNYLMQQVNAAQNAANDLGVAFSGLNATQIPVSADAGADDVAAALSKKADVSLGLGGTMSNIFASQGESYEDYCARVDALLADMQNGSTRFINAYPPDVYGRSNAQASILFKYTEDHCALTCISAASADCAFWRMVKTRWPHSTNDPVWLPFEWVNPPMDVGVEYRTTERYNRKPVYVKLVNCGAIADGKTVAHGIENPKYIIRFEGICAGKAMPQIYQKNLSDTWTVYVTYVDATNIVLTCGDSAEGAQCYVTVWYTKTTD